MFRKKWKGGKMNKKNILVIEDDSDMNTIYSRLLGKNYNVLVSTETKDARKKLAENKVDLIILDLMLTGESGKDFLSWIKKSPKYSHIEVLVISIFMAMMDEVKRDFPDVKSVSKPFQIGDLLGAVKNKLGE
jgi:two-component system sensor histidine kinase ChiS